MPPKKKFDASAGYSKPAFNPNAQYDSRKIEPEVQENQDTVADKGWLSTAASGLYETVAGPIRKLTDPNEWTNPQDPFKAQLDKLQSDMDARKAEGRSAPYRVLANTAQASGFMDPRPMEEAANRGATGEVVGHAIPPIVMAAAPLVAEGLGRGTVATGRAIRGRAMEVPEVAAQRAMTSAKSVDASQAQADVAGAKPFLDSPKDLATLQTNLPKAKIEVWKPYKEVIDRIGNESVQGPDGPTTISALEAERLKNSANLRNLEEMRPTEKREVLQKEGSVKRLKDRQNKIESALDSRLSAEGINPQLIRKTYGNLLGIEDVFQGRNTLTEKAPSGISRVGQADITKLRTYMGADFMQGARDILAGRGWWNMKPTDVNIREGFRNPGAKPDFTGPVAPAQQGPQIRGQLGPAPIIPESPYGANASTKGGAPAFNPENLSRNLSVDQVRGAVKQAGLPEGTTVGQSSAMGTVIQLPGTESSITFKPGEMITPDIIKQRVQQLPKAPTGEFSIAEWQRQQRSK